MGKQMIGTTRILRNMQNKLSVLAILGLLLGLFAPLAPAGTAYASSVSSASFTAGGVLVDGIRYAKQGQTLTLTVVTSSDTKCVEVTGAATLPRQTSSTAKTNWTFTTTAPAGNGAQAFTVAASPDFNNNNCTGKTESTQASYTLDNTGPVVSAALTPAANAAGWNNTDVTVKWTATDAGSGVTAAQPFKSDTVTSNGITTVTAPTQSDRLGNAGAAGSVTVRVDKAKPTITAAQTKNADGTTTVTFTCTDSNSGGGEASGIATCLADGSTTNSKTVQPGVTVTGTATDKAGNTATATSTTPAGDTTAPTLSSAPTTQPNANGWYKGDVTIDWTAADPESGIPTPPADTTITGEGTGLTSTTTVKNGAGLSTTATSSPAVKIDRTAPTTGISGTSNNWVNGNVTVTLAATDNLSTVASTSYAIDGAAAQTGTSFTLSAEGSHTITFFSIDKAGNAEAAQTSTIKIDKTAPTIGHTFTPLGYKDGAWTNKDVTVTFNCTDQGGSGLASCTAPVTKTTEGEGQQVVGTATDNAGNSATNTAVVSIDKTAPTVKAAADRAANSAGWYNDDVTVSFAASDALSGIASKSANKVLVEGKNQSATGTATDVAGNSASDTISGINVDKTAPVLTGTFTSGWHTGDVTVDWSCTDALSGPAGQPADDVVTGEGGDLSSTASCTDVAGNTETKTVSGIKIDRTPPTTLGSVPAVPASGWYKGAVQVTLSGSDNLSGVAATYYTVDGGVQQTYSGPFPFGTEGEHTIKFWSKDEAGNVEIAGAPLTLKIDKTAPTTTVINPISPDTGWFVTSGIPVAFRATDATSGIKATYYTIDGGARQTYGEPFTADLSTGTHTISYWSVDIAGNEEAHETTNTVEVKVDTVPPTITGAASPAANSFGWNNTDVAVKFTCDDVGSGLQTGVAGCAGDATLVNEGAGQSVTGDAVDVAGNRSNTSVGPINIDKTAPTLTGAPTTDPNAAGWYKGDVAIKWTGVDGLSGINLATQPANSTITSEGDNLGVDGGAVRISDKAGNVGANTQVSGIKIDRTKPTITGQAVNENDTVRSANAAGWFNSAVRVRFSPADALSGVAGKVDDVVLSADGANQSASGTASDLAGNGASAIVDGINIDSQAPQTSANNSCDGKNGYCRGQKATVVLTAADQAGLSGVKEIRYVVNGGQEKVAAGASVSVDVPLAAKSGLATVEYYAVDNAGNVELKGGVSLKYDNIAPSVTNTLTPKANAAGWSKADTTVHFDAKDDDGGSGVDPNTVTPDVTVNAETSPTGRVVNGQAEDLAGNLGTDAVTVKLDKTAPTIVPSVSGTKTPSGWYTGPVTVKFTCTDPNAANGNAGSGIAECPADDAITTNGANQSFTYTTTDRADNTASATVSGISIDNETPTITGVNVAGQTYTLGQVPAATCAAKDDFSGLASCTVTVSGGNSLGVGSISYSALATDKAGNASTATGTYRVIYRFDGFLQPINDTAHQVGTSTSIFKAGSTVPAKFQLKRADGTVVQANTAPAWLAPVKGSATSAPVDESVYSLATDSGTTYRYDATAQQYIYNWKSGSTGGNYWRIGVRLDDGQTYYVNIGLR